MEDYEIIREDADTRVIARQYDYMDVPDGDCYGIILRRSFDKRYERYAFGVMHADYGSESEASELAERLSIARDYADQYGPGDGESAIDTVLQRTALDWHEFRSHADRSGDEYLAIVTPAVAERWGSDPETVSARSAASDWQAWLDGEVYTLTLQRRVTWASEDGHEREEWEDVDSLGGVYGSEYLADAASDYFPIERAAS